MNCCPNCPHQASPCSRMVTFLLSLLIFFGVGGIHRFYAGKVISGLIQLATGGGFFIWQMIDIIRIIFGWFDDKDGHYI